MTNPPQKAFDIIFKSGCSFAIVTFVLGTIVAIIGDSNLGPMVGVMWGIPAFVLGLLVGVGRVLHARDQSRKR